VTITKRSLLAFAALQGLALVAPAILSSPTKGPTAESCLACADSAEVQACHKIALELAERRDFGRAIAIEEQVMAVRPGDAEVAAALAKMHRSGSRDLVRAIKLYHEALFAVPGYPPALLGLGEIMKEKGETEIAERYFARGARENPGLPLFGVRLAEVLVESGRSGQARPILDQIIAGWPESGEAEAARKLLTRTSLAGQ
jgi:tetratricopeptide (TPR) repeat protein